MLSHVSVQQHSYLTLPSCPSQHNCTSLRLSYHLFAIPPHCHWNEQKVPRCSQTHLYPYHHTISSHPHKLNRPNKETLRKGPPTHTNKQALLTLQCNSLTDPKCATDRRRSSAGTKRWSKRFSVIPRSGVVSEPETCVIPDRCLYHDRVCSCLLDSSADGMRRGGFCLPERARRDILLRNSQRWE